MKSGWKLIAVAGALLIGGCDRAAVGPDRTPTGTPETTLQSSISSSDFTGTDVTVSLVDPGVAIAAPPDAPERVVIRGLTVLSRTDTSDPRATGNTTVVANGVLSLTDGSGPVQGSFRTEVDAGGVWEGRWHGHRAMTGPAEWTATLQVQGTGHGGAIDGQRITYTNTVTTFELVPAASFGTIEGRIIAH
jgi:hypothetical protein